MKETESGDKFIGAEQKYFEWSNQNPPPKVWAEIEALALTASIKEEIKGGATNLKVLDIGVGGGKVLGLLQSLGIKSENTIGMDINGKIINLVHNLYPQIELMTGDIGNKGILEKLSDKKPFDLITASMVFNHLDDDQLKKALSNIFDLLADGGVMIALVPYPNRPEKMSVLKDTKKGFKCVDEAPWGGKTTYHHRNFSEYADYLSLSGFYEKVAVAEYEIPGREIMRIPNRLLLVGKRCQNLRDAQIRDGINVDDINRHDYMPRIMQKPNGY